MGWFTETATYDVPLEHEGEKATVTLRPLDAGDRAELQDTMRMELAAEEGSDEGRITPEMKMGSMRMLTVERAVVSWTLPGPGPTRASVRSLHPDVFEKIFESVQWGKRPADPTVAAEAASSAPQDAVS